MGKSKRRGYAGAFITGMLGGLFSLLRNPVLIALLAIAAGSGVVWGALLMLPRNRPRRVGGVGRFVNWSCE